MNRTVPDSRLAAEIAAELRRVADRLEALGDPTGLAYSRADDEPDDPTPVSPARAPMHVGVMDDGGLVDVTPAYVPQFGEAGYPGCPGCGKTVVQHLPGCREDES
jgi:hypothetical protein